MISQGKVFCKKKGEWRWSIKWNGEKKSGDFGMESMQASVGGWRVMLCAVELSPHLLHHYHYQRFIIRNRIFIMLNFAQICKDSWAHSAMNMPPSIDYQSISISYFLSSPLWSHAQFRYKGFVSESTFIWVRKGILTQRIMEQEKNMKWRWIDGWMFGGGGVSDPKAAFPCCAYSSIRAIIFHH